MEAAAGVPHHLGRQVQGGLEQAVFLLPRKPPRRDSEGELQLVEEGEERALRYALRDRLHHMPGVPEL